MTKHCSLKESFIETQLDKYQPNWRRGEDIAAETKQKIRDYVVEKLPEDLKDDVTCITDYSIWNMAQKIRKREGLPAPKKTNKGKVSERKPSTKISISEPEKMKCPKKEPIARSSPEPKNTIQNLVNEYGFDAVQNAIVEIGSEET